MKGINSERAVVAGTRTERCWLMRHIRADHLPAPPVLQSDSTARSTPHSHQTQSKLHDPKCHLRYLKIPVLVNQTRQQGQTKGWHPDKRLRFAEHEKPEEKYLTLLRGERKSHVLILFSFSSSFLYFER